MRYLIPAAGIFLALAGCKKEVDDETQTSIDNAIAEQMFSSIVPAVNSISLNDPRIYRVDSTFNSCAMVYPDSSSIISGDTMTMVIDYGSQGCIDSDGRLKQGRLICTYYDRWSDDTARVDIELQNYKVDYVVVNGTIEVTRYDLDKPVIDYTIIDGSCVDPAWTIHYECERRIEHILGASTNTPSDDKFEITGTSSGINRKKVEYTTKITTPLIKASKCKWIEAGELQITPTGLASRILDFSPAKSECDNKATIIINENTYDFELR